LDCMRTCTFKGNSRRYNCAACRQSAMAYLECRMDRQLMANEPLEKLGFKDLINEKSGEKPEKS
uniref:Uncharacterized protein n=1 Tax=Serinus canaria TaxID=9135 RepID=A0A8C9UD76_SERCA